MIPVDIHEDIENAEEREIRHRGLNTGATIRTPVSDIKIPFDLLVNKYNDYLSTEVINFLLTDEEERKYRYAPKRLSTDIYGTPEYWSLLLFINEVHSIVDFAPSQIVKIIDPSAINELINEIFILEEKI